MTARAKLTARELQVLALVMDGASNQEIADRLGMRPTTAKSHLSSIFSKLGATNRTEAAIAGLHLFGAKHAASA